MKKLLLAFIVIAGLAALVAVIVTRTEAGQNALFERGMQAQFARTPDTFDGLRVVVCGSASPLGNSPDRAQACIAVVTPEHFFLFDVGARSPLRISQARLPTNRLNGVFITHYHSDHIAALPDVNLTTWVQGRSAPLPVYGPPGIERVIEGFNIAYELDRSYRTAHHGEELLPPSVGPMQAVPFAPGNVVWQDKRMTISAFAVEHPPIAPAVGYRIDYGGRSVVISGDTNAADGLFAAAQNADLVLHDALSRAMLDPMIEGATSANVPIMPQIMNDVIDYHADTLSLPDAAAAAGIKQLVYYHLVPAPPNSIAEAIFRRGLPDSVILAKDLHTFDLPTGSSDIIVHEP